MVTETSIVFNIRATVQVRNQQRGGGYVGLRIQCLRTAGVFVRVTRIIAVRVRHRTNNVTFANWTSPPASCQPRGARLKVSQSCYRQMLNNQLLTCIPHETHVHRASSSPDFVHQRIPQDIQRIPPVFRCIFGATRLSQTASLVIFPW